MDKAERLILNKRIEEHAAKISTQKLLEEREKELENLNWSSFSEESQEILKYFGIEAPQNLNKYATSIEDAWFEQMAANIELRKQDKTKDTSTKQTLLWSIIILQFCALIYLEWS